MNTTEHFDADHIHTTPEGRHFRHGDGQEVDGEGDPVSQTREWELASLSDMAGTTGLALWVADEVCGHWTPLAAESDHADAVADYHAGYDHDAAAADDEEPLKFTWRLFRDGEEIDRGHVTFEV